MTSENTYHLTRSAKALIASPGVVLLITAVRVLIVAGYSVPTAVTIVSAGGLANTLLGTVVMLLAQYAPVLALIFIALRRPVLSVLTLGSALLISPAYATISEAYRTVDRSGLLVRRRLEGHKFRSIWLDWRELVLFIGAVLILFWWDRLVALIGKWDARDIFYIAMLKALGRLIITAIMSLVLAVVAFAAGEFVTTMFHVPTDEKTYSSSLTELWLPAEKIELKSGQSVVGYVLSTSDGWFAILIDNSRTIDYIPGTSIVTRTVCQLPQYFHKAPPPLVNLEKSSSSNVPACPTP